MATRAHFMMLADYNAWANKRLYDAAADLSGAEYRRDMRAFFGSVQGTLNHLLVGDRIWFQRVEGQGDAPTELGLILHEDFSDLRAAREAEDARIQRVVGGLSDADIAGVFAYTNLRTRLGYTDQLLSPTLTHIFNHQTHHRGQVHAMLSQLGMNPPELDLLFFIR